MKLAMALLAAAALVSQAGANEAAARARYERCKEVEESIAPQVALERAAYLEDLKRCAADGLITAQASERAAQHLQRFVATMKEVNLPGHPNSPNRFKDGRNELYTDRRTELNHLLIPQEAELASNPAWEPFQRQLRALDAVRKEIVPALQSAASDYAVEVWLAAKKPSDLAPAVRALADARASISGWDWGMAAQKLSGASFPPESIERLRGPDGRMMAAELYQIWSIVGAPVPWLLPDPVTDPAGYAAARADWRALNQIHHSFVKRPAVVARFLEMERRLSDELETRRAALHEAMLRNASAKEFDGLLKQFARLQPPPEVPARPQSGFPRQNIGRSSPDYREMIAARNPGPPDFGQRGMRRPEDSPELRAYSWWLGFRRAEEAGDAGRVALQKKELDDQLAPLPGTLRAALAARYATAPVSAAAPVATVEATPLAALLTALEKVPPQLSVGPLLAAWRQIDGLKSRVETGGGTPMSPVWFALAAKADGMQLFALRDRAAETVLAEFAGNAPRKNSSADAPLDVRLRELIAAACLAGEFENASRLLALDEACGALDPEDHAAYRRAGGIFQQARQMARDGQEDRARKACVSLIRASRLPEISDFAARVLVEGKLK